LRAVDDGPDLLLFGSDGVVRRLDGDSAGLARVVLDFTAQPRTRAEILAHLEALSGEAIDQPAVVDQLLALLTQSGQLESAVARPLPVPLSGVRVVLGISGAVAAVHTPSLALALLQQGAELRLAATRAAGRFVRFAALEALTHQPVHASLWGRQASAPVPHIDLAEWADVVLICPASATTLSRLARGDCSDVVAATALATRAPVLLAPSMNARMYLAPAVQRNLETLREDGFLILHPGRGLEVAHDPRARQPVLGAAPGPRELVDLLAAVLKATGRQAPRRAPQSAREWDSLYAASADADLSWHSERLDDDLADALPDVSGAPRMLLDVGTGLGTVAIEASRRGYTVVATDLAGKALARAQARAPELPITWVEDDITASRLRGTFAVVIDRGCLHLLPAEQRPSYAATVTRLTAPGATLLLKLDSPAAGPARQTHRFTADELPALLPAFELVRATPSTLARTSAPGDATLYLFRRR
jgi:SAM-dependent methyltransferase/3-polyprenyl-4-hydroxybenzoate decarboxylase